MAEVLFINEDYYKKVIPHVRGIDDNQLISTIRLVQKTDLVSLITQPVYDRLVAGVVADDLVSAEEALLVNCQMFISLKAAEQLTYIQPTRDDNQRDVANVAFKNKATLIEARIIRDIKNDSDLSTLAGTSDVDFIDDEMPSSGGFFYI